MCTATQRLERCEDRKKKGKFDFLKLTIYIFIQVNIYRVFLSVF